MKLFDILKTHSVFASLEEEEQMYLAQHARVHPYQKGEVVAVQGDEWPHLFLILKGEIQAVKVSPEGRALMVTTFSRNEIFWGPAFFEEGLLLPVTLEAAQPATLAIWSRAVLEPLLVKGGIGWALARLMLQYMLRANILLERLAFQPVTARLAHLLLEHFQATESPAIPRTLTLDEIAARIGTTREVVCRTLYYLADRNMIEVTRTEFILVDREGLKHLAEGS